MFYHLTPLSFSPESIASRVTSRGWIGVDLFFVLSGYLITGILLDAKSSPSYFSSFYARRILRIFPLYYSVLTVVFVSTRFRQGELGNDQIWYWLHLSNLRTAFGHSWNSILSHFWSLSIEEQFYAAWPLVVFWVPRRKLGWLCILIAFICVMLRNLPQVQLLNHTYPNFCYRFTVLRLDGLALGSGVAVLRRENQLHCELRRFAGPALAILATASVLVLVFRHAPESAVMTRVGYSLFAMTFAAAVYVCQDTRVAILRATPLLKCGAYSYGMYVFHYPILVILRTPGTAFVPYELRLAVALFATYLAAWCSWHLIERRVLSLKSYFKY